MMLAIHWTGCCRKYQLVPKFKEYDADGNGYITLEEASFILENPPFNFPPSKVIFLLKHFDKDGNGKLDIEEFAGFYAEAKATSVIALSTPPFAIISQVSTYVDCCVC